MSPVPEANLKTASSPPYRTYPSEVLMPRLHNIRCAHCSQDLPAWLTESPLNLWDRCPLCGSHLYVTGQGLGGQETDMMVCLTDAGRLGLDVAFLWQGNATPWRPGSPV